MADSLLFQKHLCPEPGGGRGLLVPHDRTDFHWFIDSSHKYLLSLLFNYEDEPERRMFASRPPNKEIPLNEMASRHLDWRGTNIDLLLNIRVRHFTYIMSPWCLCMSYYYLHFLGGETEAQRGSVTYLSCIDRKCQKWSPIWSGSKSQGPNYFCYIACSHTSF